MHSDTGKMRIGYTVVDQESISLEVNGNLTELVVSPSETLIALIRERLGLTGTKVSCDEEVCGSCTVLVGGLPVSSCTFLARDAVGKAVQTIEGLATRHPDGSVVLDRVQEAFVAHFAFQCGFCTPGMIIATKALLQDHTGLSREEIAERMSGNLCRCTGYDAIFQAIESLMDDGSGPFQDRAEGLSGQ